MLSVMQEKEINLLSEGSEYKHLSEIENIISVSSDND